MNIDKTLVARFFNGECTETEARKVMEWMRSPASDQFFARQTEEAWKDAGNKMEQTDDVKSEFIKQVILQKVRNERVVYTRQPTRTRPNFAPWWWAAAAVFIVVLAIGIHTRFSSKQETPLAVQSPAVVVKENPRGQKTKAFLPDGSIVWLNAESSLMFPEQFTDSTRSVQLEGEAYFEVVHNPARPFVVMAGNTITRVLGTSFNIKAYGEDHNVTVALTEGKVEVWHRGAGDHGDAEQLNPGEGLMAANDGHIKRFIFDPREHTAWKDGLLYFRKADFNTVRKALERWYGVDFEIHNFRQDDWNFTGSFRNEYLTTVLDNLSYAREFDYEIDNKKVIVKFKHDAYVN
jgi:ferric-dicitrate binding protein FerR (iron transport regulator)